MSSPARRGRGVLRLSAIVAVLALSASCAESAPPESQAPVASLTFASTEITPATLVAGQSVAAPTGKPILTLTGLITATNSKGALAFDQATLDLLGTREIRVYEPWVKQNTEFRGVWLQDLLTVAGVQPEATKLRIIALDDYTVELSLADVRAGGVLLATGDGEGDALPIDHGGPTRIAFMDGVQAGVNPDHWVWSLKTIDVI